MKESQQKVVQIEGLGLRKKLAGIVKTACLVASFAIPLMGTGVAHASTDFLKDSMLPTETPREEIQRILDHYPAGSISSVAKADEILDVVDQAKKNIEARLYNEKLICNDRFFVYDCYDEAESRKRVDMRAITMLEVEAKRYKRADDIRQSDLQRDIDEMDEIADAPDRYDNAKSHEEKLKRVQEKEKKREMAAQGKTDSPNKKHQGNLMTPKEKEQNAKDYAEKQKSKEKHLKEVEEKKAKTEKRRADAVKRKEEEAKKKEQLKKAGEKAAARRNTF